MKEKQLLREFLQNDAEADYYSEFENKILTGRYILEKKQQFQIPNFGIQNSVKRKRTRD